MNDDIKQLRAELGITRDCLRYATERAARNHVRLHTVMDDIKKLREARKISYPDDLAQRIVSALAGASCTQSIDDFQANMLRLVQNELDRAQGEHENAEHD